MHRTAARCISLTLHAPYTCKALILSGAEASSRAEPRGEAGSLLSDPVSGFALTWIGLRAVFVCLRIAALT